MAKPKKPGKKGKGARGKIVRIAGGQGGKGKGKGPRKGISKSQMTDIRYGFGGQHDPNETWAGMNKRQRQVTRRVSKRRGTSLSGTLSGGPVALQERSPQGLRDTARKNAAAAYKPAEGELNDRESMAQNLLAKQEDDEQRFGMWMAGEHAKMETSAQVADQALAQQYQQMQTNQDAAYQQGAAAVAAQPQIGSSSSADYTGRQIQLAREQTAGHTSAAAGRAQAGAQSGRNVRSALTHRSLTNVNEARSQNKNNFWKEMQDIGLAKKDLARQKSADISKEMARLADQQIDVAQANRENRMLAQELDIKGFEAQTDRQADRAANKLNWQKYKSGLSLDQMKLALDRVKVQISQGNLSVAQQKAAETARHNLQTEIQARKSGKSKKGGPGAPTAGETAVWRDVEAGRGVATQLMRTKRVSQDVGEVAKALRQRGYPDHVAQAAAELVTKGSVSRSTRQRLRNAGGYTPKQWR